MNTTLFKSLLNKKINGKSLVRILIVFFLIQFGRVDEEGEQNKTGNYGPTQISSRKGGQRTKYRKKESVSPPPLL